MKKSFLKSTAALFVAAAMVLTGCEQATTVSNTADNTILSLGGPANLKADVGTAAAPLVGGVILTWDLDSNAYQYEVWRKVADGGSFTKLTTTPLATASLTEGKYADVISGTNVLEDSTKYTYKVVAVSANSTSRVAIVQNGETNIDVTTLAGQFPAAGDEAVVQAVTGVTVTVDNVLGTANVTWTNPNTNPLVRLVVSGNRNGTLITPATLPADATFYDYSNFTAGSTGTINVGVQAVFNGNSNYYPASAVVYDDEVYDIPALGSLTASIYYAARQNNSTQVVIQFADNPSAPSADYKLERAVVVNDTAPRDWTYEVPTAGKIKTLISGTYYWQVTDTVALTDKVEYRLTVSTVAGISKVSSISDNGVSNDYDSTVYAATVGTTVSNFGLTAVDAGTSAPKVQINWDATTGSDYELARAVVTFGDNETFGAITGGTAVPTNVPAYTTVPVTSANYVAGKGVVTDDSTALAKGTFYQYKLTEKVGDVTVNEETQVVNHQVFSNFSLLQLTVPSARVDRLPGKVYIPFDNSDKWLKVDDVVKVYRRLSSAVAPYVEQTGLATTISTTNVGDALFTVIDTPPDGSSYDYKLVVSRNNKDMKDTSIVTRTATRTSISYGSSSVSNHGPGNGATISLNGAYLDGQVTVRIYVSSVQYGVDHPVTSFNSASGTSATIFIPESWLWTGGHTNVVRLYINGSPYNPSSNSLSR
ncbi:hypothetical protein AGMMS49944_28330 [Spirochaetia bacterium]|nr:hypothetical protein AGMMS49944_28330 [Spirochaetia bacterium]